MSLFDADRGLGIVLEADGTAFGFHSTAISDGSRRIEAGCPVVFALVAVVGGRFEAARLAPF